VVLAQGSFYHAGKGREITEYPKKESVRKQFVTKGERKVTYKERKGRPEKRVRYALGRRWEVTTVGSYLWGTIVPKSGRKREGGLAIDSKVILHISKHSLTQGKKVVVLSRSCKGA